MPDFGNIEISGKDIGIPPTPYDRIAVHGQTLCLLSVVAPPMTIKAIRAILNGGARATISAAGGKVRQPGASEWIPYRQPGSLFACNEGYTGYVHRLDYGLDHAMFITRQPGFMVVSSEPALWQELNDNRFTTPILREWVPYVAGKLKEQDLLVECESFNCSCGFLACTSKELDEIVSDGIKSGEIKIPRKVG